jgi:hypothetical protein
MRFLFSRKCQKVKWQNFSTLIVRSKRYKKAIPSLQEFFQPSFLDSDRRFKSSHSLASALFLSRPPINTNEDPRTIRIPPITYAGIVEKLKIATPIEINTSQHPQSVCYSLFPPEDARCAHHNMPYQPL